MVTKEDLIKRYNMMEHPEGGFFVETFRSEAQVTTPSGPRSASTAIYFLVSGDNISRLHRIKSDEVWHFYLGGSITVVELDPVAKQAKLTELGPDVAAGQLLQHVVKANTWFGSYPTRAEDFCFVGCTVAPGFDFADFEMGSRSALLAEFPEAADVIEKMTVGLP